MNIKKIRRKFNLIMKRNFYYRFREWPYKNVKPRIIAEEYMDDGSGELNDYKFFCFNGIPKIVLVCSERFSSNNMCESWFDDKWNLLPITENGHRVDKNIPCPTQFEKMKRLASKLSNNIPFVRIDFYEINKKIYFGEITFFPNSGFEKFEPEEYDKIFGDLLQLPKIND